LFCPYLLSQKKEYHKSKEKIQIGLVAETGGDPVGTFPESFKLVDEGGLSKGAGDFGGTGEVDGGGGGTRFSTPFGF
jgi:hypothetical protein